jgi:hypothetical protein
MCFSSPKIPQDNSAQLAQQQEATREANIKQGQSSIDTAFSQFDPAYYENYQKAYEDNYNPQVDEQFANARRGVKYDAARKGVEDSTPGQTAFSNLTGAYDTQRRNVASNALNASNVLRSNVEAQKSNLYSLNTSAADPSLAAQNATAQVGALQTMPSYSPLGDIFGSLVNSYAAYQTGKNAVNPYAARVFTPGSTSPGNSGKVVG